MGDAPPYIGKMGDQLHSYYTALAFLLSSDELCSPLILWQSLHARTCGT